MAADVTRTHYRAVAHFLQSNYVIQPDWVEQWSELEAWLNQYTPGWTYVQVGNHYYIEFVRGPDLTLYTLMWAN